MVNEATEKTKTDYNETSLSGTYKDIRSLCFILTNKT